MSNDRIDEILDAIVAASNCPPLGTVVRTEAGLEGKVIKIIPQSFRGFTLVQLSDGDERWFDADQLEVVKTDE